jgi:hypothetical protein
MGMIFIRAICVIRGLVGQSASCHFSNPYSVQMRQKSVSQRSSSRSLRAATPTSSSLCFCSGRKRIRRLSSSLALRAVPIRRCDTRSATVGVTCRRFRRAFAAMSLLSLDESRGCPPADFPTAVYWICGSARADCRGQFLWRVQTASVYSYAFKTDDLDVERQAFALIRVHWRLRIFPGNLFNRK